MLQADMFGNYMGVKRCACCRKLKEFFEFNTSKRSKDGLQSYCKTCQKIYHVRHPHKEYKRQENDASLDLGLE